MTASGLKSATFLSLDVEGSEEVVLNTVDPARFMMILVEMNNGAEEKNERVRAQLKRAGMQVQPVLTKMIGNSDVFIRNDVAELVHRCIANTAMGCSIPACEPPRRTMTHARCLKTELV